MPTHKHHFLKAHIWPVRWASFYSVSWYKPERFVLQLSRTPAVAKPMAEVRLFTSRPQGLP